MARRPSPSLGYFLAPLAGLACAAALSLPASAQQPPPPPRPELPQLSLEASAARDVAQDKVEITLANEIEGSDQAGVADQLNKLVETALNQAKRETRVTSRTGSYRIWANTDRNGKITGWRGRAELVLESKDFVAASTLAGDLGKLMAVSNVAFSLSREAREAEEHSLLAEAAAAFKARANDAARAFGFGGYAIRQLDLSGSGTVYQPPRPYAMRASAMEAKAADAVPLEAGKATVTVSVRGTVDLIGTPAR
ncbi:SIMPL domain-containing protein [Pigmentiphaga soli]|uniref:SIMPL domain-containing protein n=1 Tax=Pigmentiphaga soli TaxID=1007095 RepID=A0ABP8H4G3_9BURK